jgi:hypothetical protein
MVRGAFRGFNRADERRRAVREEATLIRVQADWNAWETAEVRLEDLQDVHWFQPLGAPRPMLHGYVLCGNILSGSVPHECDGKGAQHRLLVCMLKKHMVPSAYVELASRCEHDLYAMMPFLTA